MNSNEEEVQEALGLLKLYSAPIVISVPYSATVNVLIEVEVKATSIEDARAKALAQLKNTPIRTLKKKVRAAAEDELFRNMNREEDMSVLYDRIVAAHPSTYQYDEYDDPTEVEV